ncbi:MAG TPA: sodium:proton antiporter [Burkholderiaceae bacterium]|nr:sodium:proton antiporter [Burkholderiaceae bacterium]
MQTFEWIILLLLGASALTALARYVGAPYPTFLAIGGALLAFVPDGPRWVLDPHLALTLFVAPVLMDAAYDTSLRDLRTNWRPIARLVVAAVGLTVIAVALLAHALVPGMPWAVAVALGAIVAPPDAAAATAVMRQVKLPYKLLSIAEGESLLNDASALLIYRVAIMAAVGQHLGLGTLAPVLLLTVAGSLVAGFVAARLIYPLFARVDDVPTSLILQFASTFGVWTAAEAAGLSGVLTIVAFAMTIARGRGLPARMRVPVFMFWETAVFVLNALSFVLIGLQLRPIVERLANRGIFIADLKVALAVLALVVVARFVWVLGSKYLRLPGRRKTGDRPSLGAAIALSWAGMRGIVTLAAAFALPETLPDGTPFPYRDLVLLCAFTVVLGTLVLQGLTLKPLVRRLALGDDDPVGREVRVGRVEVFTALLAEIEGDASDHADLLRQQYGHIVGLNRAADLDDETIDRGAGGPLRRRALSVAQARAFELRNAGVIGDAAYRVIVAELSWAELDAGAGIYG